MYDDDVTRLIDLARIFQAQADERQQRAADPQAFVRLAYIGKSALDRVWGPANTHSADLVALCDALEAPPEAFHGLPSPHQLADCYRVGARILRTALVLTLPTARSAFG